MARRKQPPLSTAQVRVPSAPPQQPSSLPAHTSPASSGQAAIIPDKADARDGTPVFTFPNLANALGAIGAAALLAVPVGLAMTARQVEMLYHLGFPTTWYIASLLPRSFVLARLGTILLGWTAVRCLALFIIELFIVSLIEARWKIKDNSPWQFIVRYYASLILVSGIIIIIATGAVGRVDAETIPAMSSGLLLGTALGLTTIPAQDLGTLNNHVARLIWTVFLTYLAALIATYYSLPHDTHILPAVELSIDKDPILSGDLIADTNGYWYVIARNPARVMMIRDDRVRGVTIPLP